MKKEQEKENTLRRLTSGEIALAKSVFMSSIPYHKIRIYRESYLPSGLQSERAERVTEDKIYCRPLLYREDYAQSLPEMQHLFIHEMAHVWQRVKRMNAIDHRQVSWITGYTYQLDGRLLAEYSMAQQAQIIADSFTLEMEGHKGWRDLIRFYDITLDDDLSEPVARQQYRHVLMNFPWD